LREKTEAVQQTFKFFAVLGFYRRGVIVALVASAIVADAVGVKLDAGKRFREDAFAAELHKNPGVRVQGQKEQGSGNREQGQKTVYRIEKQFTVVSKQHINFLKGLPWSFGF